MVRDKAKGAIRYALNAPLCYTESKKNEAGFVAESGQKNYGKLLASCTVESQLFHRHLEGEALDDIAHA